MRTVRLNLSRCTSREEAHRYLKAKFRFPEYYGENLDALYDCMTDIAEDTEIVFEETEDACCRERLPDDGIPYGEEPVRDSFQRFIKTVRRVIEDAAEENSHLYLQVEKQV